jgi:hypothetical protein
LPHKKCKRWIRSDATSHEIKTGHAQTINIGLQLLYKRESGHHSFFTEIGESANLHPFAFGAFPSRLEVGWVWGVKPEHCPTHPHLKWNTRWTKKLKQITQDHRTSS